MAEKIKYVLDKLPTHRSWGLVAMIARLHQLVLSRLVGYVIISCALGCGPVEPIQAVPIRVAEQNESFYESTVKQRIDAGLKFIQKKPWPDPIKNVDYMVDINGLPINLEALPEGLQSPDGLGLVFPPEVSGKLIYQDKEFTDCPRAILTPKGDYLMMSPVGRHYGRDLKNKCNDMMAFRSKDKGKTWSGPTVAYDIDYSQHGFIPLIPKGSARIYNFGTQPITDAREGMENSPIGFRYSDDDGHTWSKVELIKPINDPDFKGMSCMRMTETTAGTWLLGSHEADWTKKPLQTRQYILRSEDKGKTWKIGPNPRHDGWYVPKFGRMDEGRPIALGGAGVLMMMRTPEGHLWTARSEDDGKSWSDPSPTPLIHPDAPPMLFHLSDGKTLAAFHHNRHGDTVYTTLDSNKGEMMKDRQEVWVSLSTDEGRIWSEPRFVYANAMTRKLQNAWWTYNCSYMDMFVDDGVLNLFFPHRWSRLIHLQLKEEDLIKLPTIEQLKVMLSSDNR